METDEILTSTFMPEDPKEFLKKVTQMGSSDSGLQMTQYSDIQLALHERYLGKYKDDLEGFKQEIKRIHASHVKGEKNVMLQKSQSYDQMVQNVKKFDEDIQMQLKLRANDIE